MTDHNLTLPTKVTARDGKTYETSNTGRSRPAASPSATSAVELVEVGAQSGAPAGGAGFRAAAARPAFVGGLHKHGDGRGRLPARDGIFDAGRNVARKRRVRGE